MHTEATVSARRARWRPFEYAFWLAALASVFLLPGRHLILTEIAWLALFALSLDLILGYAGIISLGHAAFFGLGSYVAAIMMDRFGLPYWSTLPAAGLTCFVAGFLFGLPALRLRLLAGAFAAEPLVRVVAWLVTRPEYGESSQ